MADNMIINGYFPSRYDAGAGVWKGRMNGIHAHFVFMDVDGEQRLDEKYEKLQQDISEVRTIAADAQEAAEGGIAQDLLNAANDAVAAANAAAEAAENKADINHSHSASDITSGTLPIARGGTGNTAGSAATLTTSRTIDGVSFNGSAAITHYGTCGTAAGTAAKTASITGFTLATGARATVKFTYENTAASPTLNITGTGAKSMFYNGMRITSAFPCLQAGGAYTFVYDGTNYVLEGAAVCASTTDLTAGSSALPTGMLYVVYE